MLNALEYLEQQRAEEYVKRRIDGAGNAPWDFDRVETPWFYREHYNLPFCAECVVLWALQRDGEQRAC